MKGQCRVRGPGTGSGATPLVDATVRFFEEFMFKEEQSLKLTAIGKQREDKEQKKRTRLWTHSNRRTCTTRWRRGGSKFCWYVLMPRMRSSVTCC